MNVNFVLLMLMAVAYNFMGKLVYISVHTKPCQQLFFNPPKIVKWNMFNADIIESLPTILLPTITL